MKLYYSVGIAIVTLFCVRCQLSQVLSAVPSSSGLLDGVTSGSSGTASGVQPAKRDPLFELVDALAPILKILAPILESLAPTLMKLGPILDALLSSLLPQNTTFGAQGPNPLGDLLGGLLGPGSPLGGILGGVLGSVASPLTGGVPLVNTVGGVVGGLLDPSSPVGGALGSVLGAQSLSGLGQSTSTSGSGMSSIGSVVSDVPLAQPSAATLLTPQASGTHLFRQSSPQESCESNCGSRYYPICTTNGNTYDNPCFFDCSGEAIQCIGACPCPLVGMTIGGVPCMCDPSEYNPVCTTEGETLRSRCIANCLHKTIMCSSTCPC